jgi:hypothetical protein
MSRTALAHQSRQSIPSFQNQYVSPCIVSDLPRGLLFWFYSTSIPSLTHPALRKATTSAVGQLYSTNELHRHQLLVAGLVRRAVLPFALLAEG